MADNMILGKGCKYSTDSNVTGLNNNVIVCGGSGSGKTMSVSEPKLLETFESNLFVTVTKHRIVDKYTPVLEDRGYNVMEINFADPLKSTIGFDPLKYVKSANDARFLAEALVRSGGNMENFRGDPYWDNAAISLLTAEIGLALAIEKEPSFLHVLRYQKMIEFKSEGLDDKRRAECKLDGLFHDLARRKPNHYALNCWKSFADLPLVTGSCVYGSLNTMLDKIFTPELCEIFSRPEQIDFEEIAKKKTVLFLTTSPVNPSLQSFVNIFYSNAFKSLFEYAENRPDGRLPIPMHMLCDDFATGGQIANFTDYISIFREKGVSVTLLLQSESQLESMYGTVNATTIINNCDSYVYLGSMDIVTARNIGIRMNKPTDEILSMPIGQEILIRRGQKPLKTKRYNITEDELYQKITREYEAGLRSVSLNMESKAIARAS